MAKLYIIVSLPLLAAVVCGVVMYKASVPKAPGHGQRASETLQLLIVVCRHGNRGPLFTFPTNPYPPNASAFWPYGDGQLTGRGRAQLYKLGEKVRSLYNGFLDDKYYNENLKAFSTSVDRTLMSAQAFLAGLYPPKDFQVWNEQLPWQPLPIFHSPSDHTELLAGDPSRLCPRFAVAQRKSMARFYEENGPNLTALLVSLLPHTGMEPSSTTRAFSLRRLWDPLICADTEGLPLPPWAREIYPQPLETWMATAEVASTIGSDDMIRLLQGQLFQEMASIMQTKVNGSLNPDRRLFLYSGHDMTIRGLQGVLGLKASGLSIIKPGSALLLEMHRDQLTSQHYVQVLYIDGSSSDLEPALVTVPGCSPQCSLQVLLNITDKYHSNITDYNKECQNNI